MWPFIRVGLQRSVSWRHHCSMLELAQHRHAAAKPVPWTKRVNKVATQKLISRAKTLAHASSAPPVAGREAGAPSLTSRVMTVPQIQQPQELFNSAMKPVRKLKPRADLRFDLEVASNLVCTFRPCTSHMSDMRFTLQHSSHPQAVPPADMLFRQQGPWTRS